MHRDRSLTYAELNRRADRVAQRLRGLGVVPETLVGVCLRRTPEMVVALLAILKAGGAYVPLDPQYPKERLGLDAGGQSHPGAADPKGRGGQPAGSAATIVLLDQETALARMPCRKPRSCSQRPHQRVTRCTAG